MRRTPCRVTVTALVGLVASLGVPAFAAKGPYPAYTTTTVALGRPAPYRVGSHLRVVGSVNRRSPGWVPGKVRLIVVTPLGATHHFTWTFNMGTLRTHGDRVVRKISLYHPGRYKVTVSFIPNKGQAWVASTATKTFHVKAAKKKHHKKK